jgi:hypothetical protein
MAWQEPRVTLKLAVTAFGVHRGNLPATDERDSRPKPQ